MGGYLIEFSIIPLTLYLATPGQDFCTWTGEDMSQIQFPIATVFNKDFEEIYKELLAGSQIEINLTSEGIRYNFVCRSHLCRFELQHYYIRKSMGRRNRVNIDDYRVSCISGGVRTRTYLIWSNQAVTVH